MTFSRHDSDASVPFSEELPDSHVTIPVPPELDLKDFGIKMELLRAIEPGFPYIDAERREKQTITVAGVAPTAVPEVRRKVQEIIDALLAQGN